MDTFTLSLLRDYKEICDAIGSGQYSTSEIRQLNGDRSVLHEQLIAALGFDRDSVDMYDYARRALHAARGSGWQ